VSLKPRSNRYNKPLPSPFSLLAEFSPLRRFVSLHRFVHRTLFGGGLLISRNVLEKLGGWDSRFFLWFEDSDLTMRLITSNFRIGWVDVPYTHKGGISFELLSEKKRKKIFFESMEHFAGKHFSHTGRWVVKFLSILNQRHR
jgi:GT2 family glycosyltransferase